MRVAIAVLASALLLAGCRLQEGPSLTDWPDAETGFVVRAPSDWIRANDGAGHTRFTPPVPTGQSARPGEFIIVSATEVTGPLDEPAIRQLVFSSLPIYGVSGFVKDPRSTATVRWDKFEVTGSSGGVQWASVGVVVSGATRTYLVVCAKPFDKWKDGQKQCDEVVRTFQPGRLK